MRSDTYEAPACQEAKNEPARGVRLANSCNDVMDVYGPCVNPAEVWHEYGISPIAEPKPVCYDAIVIAVGHREFADMGSTRIHALGKSNHVLYDIKYLLPAQDSDARI